MAQIIINEISDNYTYNIGTSSYATIAMPITAAWGPAYMDPASVYGSTSDQGDVVDLMLENTSWTKFPATQAGLEAFVSTFRGPSSNYRVANDYSYQMAMTLLAAGYDVLACRVAPGAKAAGGFKLTQGGVDKNLTISAKYPGTFGNNLVATLQKMISGTFNYWSLVVYIKDSATGIQSAVENLTFVFDEDNSTDSVPYIGEVESAFLTFAADSGISDTAATTITPIDSHTATDPAYTQLSGGTDALAITPTYGTTADNATSHSGGNVHEIGGTGADAGFYAEVLTKPVGWGESGFVYTGYYTLEGTVSEGVTTWAATAATSATAWAEHTIFKKFASMDAVILANPQTEGLKYAKIRYGVDSRQTAEGFYTGVYPNVALQSAGNYVAKWNNGETITDVAKLNALVHMEWVYNASFLVYQLLQDKLNYNPQRIMTPGWDDQNILALTGTQMFSATLRPIVSPLHTIIMQTAYLSRCATGLIDVPKALPRGLVYNESTEDTSIGYAQMLSRATPFVGGSNTNAKLYTSHSALFAPWGQYKYLGTNKMRTASPSFLAMLIQRAQILNQAAQYEWALPTNRRHSLNIGKMDYAVPKKLLDTWQSLEGVGVDIITKLPDLGTNLWGNSTLFEVPPATYQALANLSTRYLVNAIEDVAYRSGLAITFQYNNSAAFSAFYAGVSPLLDAMLNLGAIEDYKIKMAADINGLDQVNANSVVGTIWLSVAGVVNDITIDLIALPPGTDLNQFAG